MIIAEPVQNAGGALVPPEGYWAGLRELADKYGIALVADEVITGFGRFGEWFAAPRYGATPDLITVAKGITSAYAPMGAVIASDRVFEPFSQDKTSFLHGITFGGHPVAAAVALANLDVFEEERLLEHVRANEGAFGAMLDSLRDIPIVGDVRGLGYFWAIELVRDRETKQTFSADECEWLLRGFLSARIYDNGLICRADDRGDPVIQLAPPLIAGPEQFEEIRSVLRPALEEASRRLDLH
jgi:adenosylmethionine-8-amino-7-oxononanoate aminotransferase